MLPLNGLFALLIFLNIHLSGIPPPGRGVVDRNRSTQNLLMCIETYVAKQVYMLFNLLGIVLYKLYSEDIFTRLIFHSGSVREFPNASRPETSREEASPKCQY